jgi:hypothetical protein
MIPSGPDVDFVALAAGFNVPGSPATTLEEPDRAAREGCRQPIPIYRWDS